jgi:hypothetical protein
VAAQRAIKTNWVAAYQRYVLKAGPKLIVTRPDVTVDPTSPITDTTTTVPGATTTTAPITTTTPTTPTVPTVTTSSPDPYDTNGFYASSYGSASTIYCADDPA